MHAMFGQPSSHDVHDPPPLDPPALAPPPFAPPVFDPPPLFDPPVFDPPPLFDPPALFDPPVSPSSSPSSPLSEQALSMRTETISMPAAIQRFRVVKEIIIVTPLDNLGSTGQMG